VIRIRNPMIFRIYTRLEVAGVHAGLPIWHNHSSPLILSCDRLQQNARGLVSPDQVEAPGYGFIACYHGSDPCLAIGHIKRQSMSKMQFISTQPVTKKIAVALSLAAFLMAGSARSQSPTNTTLTLPNMPLHDPWMLVNEPDKTYYLYTSNIPKLSGTAGTGTMVYRSHDLKHWQPPVMVFHTSEMHWAQQGAWAPEVHRWRGKYYLFTTVHDDTKPLPPGRNAPHPTYRRGTISAVSDSPLGPFHPLNPEGPLPPADFMALDGTLYVDPDQKPWLVYAHEWLQKTDGSMEAVPLADDLSRSAGDPIFLFKASDAPWFDKTMVPSTKSEQYVTDGPELYRTHDGHLLMLWSSYGTDDKYIQTIARSQSGTLKGPWQQLDPLVYEDSGHGMLFKSFDGSLMLILHRPFRNARGKIYAMKDAGDHLEVLNERTDLD